jgi:uncharacterized delta-60 repeat protein
MGASKGRILRSGLLVAFCSLVMAAVLGLGAAPLAAGHGSAAAGNGSLAAGAMDREPLCPEPGGGTTGALASLAPGVSRTKLYAWARSFGGSEGESAWTVQQTADGGYAVAGYTWSFGAGDSDVWVLKLAPDGAIQWQKTYGGGDDDLADLIFQTSDGGYAVAGYTASSGAGGTDVWVLKLRADGTIEWQKTYGGPDEDEAVSVQETTDGGYVVAGETKSFGAGDWDIWILKLDDKGAIEWQKTYGGEGLETCSADPIQQTPDGGYVVTGRTASFGAGEQDVWVLRLKADGDIKWQKTYGGSSYEEAHAVRRTLDGGFAVAGFTASFGKGGWDVWVLKLSEAGAVQWQKTFGGENNEWAWSVYETADGGCVVAGETQSFGSGPLDFWILKLAEDGTLDWQKVYGAEDEDWGESIRQTADGGYVAVGATESFATGDDDDWDWWVLKLDKHGEIPGCPLGADSDAVPANTSVSGVDSSATPATSAAEVSEPHVSPVSSEATVKGQCFWMASYTYLPQIRK